MVIFFDSDRVSRGQAGEVADPCRNFSTATLHSFTIVAHRRAPNFIASAIISTGRGKTPTAKTLTKHSRMHWLNNSTSILGQTQMISPPGKDSVLRWTWIQFLTNWQPAVKCVEFLFEFIGDLINGFIQIVERTHVNLVDLTDSFTSGRNVTMFRSEGELSEYTIENDRYFPRKNVHAGNLLKHLLRNIHNPSANRGRRRL